MISGCGSDSCRKCSMRLCAYVGFEPDSTLRSWRDRGWLMVELDSDGSTANPNRTAPSWRRAQCENRRDQQVGDRQCVQ